VAHAGLHGHAQVIARYARSDSRLNTAPRYCALFLWPEKTHNPATHGRHHCTYLLTRIIAADPAGERLRNDRIRQVGAKRRHWSADCHDRVSASMRPVATSIARTGAPRTHSKAFAGQPLRTRARPGARKHARRAVCRPDARYVHSGIPGIRSCSISGRSNPK
jgi:hypothetical protein